MTFQALLFCPDEKTARVTTQVLTELEFSVDACTEPFAAVKKLMGQHFDAVVVDCENEQNATLLFKSARNSTSNQGALAVAVVEGQAGVANAFRIGANLVLTKPINVEQAKSTLRVARGLLRKGTEAKATQSAPTGTPVQPSRPVTPSPATSAAPVPAVTARPVPAPAPAKPVAPVFAPSPMVAKTTVEAGGPTAPEAQSKAPSTGSSADLFEAPTAAVPANSTNKVPLAPRPAEPPAKAATASGKIPVQPPAAASPSGSGKVPLFQAKPVLRSGVGVGQSGAAAAPAPAKENAKPIAPVFQEKPGMLTQSGKGNAADGLFESGTVNSQPMAAPSFAAFGSGEESEGSSASKTGIIVAIVILALAAAGYLGYTKFARKKQATPAPAAAPQSQPSSPDAVPVSSNSPEVVQQASAVLPTAAQATHSQPAALSHASSTAKEPNTDAEPEVVVTHPEPEKALAVKSDVARASTKPVASAEISAPPVIGTGETTEAGAISDIVQSAPVALPKVAAPQTLRVSQGVTEGLLIKKVPPTYPRQAIQMHVQGAVQLQAMIDRQGRISSVKVLKGDPMLARAAVDAVNQWRYKPYFLDGQPVDIQTQITVNFKLP